MAQSTRDDTSVDIQSIIDNLGDVSLSSVTSYIFRVPEVLRKNNPNAYQPDMVVIGPLHDRTEKKYQHMEKVKRWYLHKYVLSSVDLAKLIEVVAEKERLARARDCYAESLDHIMPNVFIEWMILDGCFIVELFRKFTYKHGNLIDGSQPNEHDPILSMDCMIQYIWHDILLLENQLPWDVLRSLYSLISGNHDNSDFFLSNLILKFFQILPSVKNDCVAYRNHLCRHDVGDHKHVLDLLRTSILHSYKASDAGETRCLQRAEGEKPDIRKESKDISPATTLSKGGVKFQYVSHDDKISIISMGFKDGVLTIPQLVIDELTEPLFRNLIAFEQCSQSHSHDITSYATLMDKLISSKEDMEFLCEKNIIRNWLSAEDGFKIFNKIHNDTLLNEFHYDELCTSVNKYYNVKHHRLIGNFRRKCFDAPWTMISLIAAIILLFLTLVQTILTVRDSGIVFFMQ